MRRLMLVLPLALLALAGRAEAQEVQVSMDEAGRVERVERRLAERLGLWIAEYPGFQEARLFQSADSSFVLEISTVREGRLVRERLPRTPAEVAQLRRQVQAVLDERSNLDERGVLNQEGRYLLLGQTTLAGLAFYGWAVPVVLDATEGSTGASLYLLTSAASFFAPFALTQNRPVTYGMANLSRYGVTRGVFHGVLLHNLIAGDRDPVPVCVPDRPCDDVYYVEDPDERGRMAGALLLSAAEGVGGYLWARNERMSAGTANAIAAGGDAGLFWGLGTAMILGTDDMDERTAAAIALPFTAAGIVGGHQLAKRRDYTWGDADLLYTAGIVGILSGVAAGDLVGVEDEEVMTGAAMLGSAAGFLIADRMVRTTDFSVGQATLNRLGTLAGALAGASLGAMTEEPTVALTGAALGAAAGFALTFAALAPDAPAGRGERMPSAAWEVRLQPQGLLAAGLGRQSEAVPAPLFSVRYRF